MKKITLTSVLLLCTLFNFTQAQNLEQINTDETTESSCIDLSTKVLKYKSRDANTNGEVSVLQDYLNDKGFLTQGATGFYGLKTVDAVKKFQRSNGIMTTGSVGALTKKFIYNDTCVEQKTTDVISSSTIKIETTAPASDLPKVKTGVIALLGVKPSSESSPNVQWGNDTFSLASKPDAKDKWRDRFGVKELPEDLFVMVEFDKKEPNSGAMKRKNIEGVTLSGRDPLSGWLGNPGVKSENLAVFWGKKIVVKDKGLYQISVNTYGQELRIIVDNKVVYSSLDEKKLSLVKTVTLLLEQGNHDLEIELVSNGYTNFSFDIKPTQEVEDRYNSSTTLAIPTGSDVHYVQVNKSVTTKAKVSIQKGFSPEYVILASFTNINWEFVGDTSSIKGVIVGRGSVTGLGKDVTIAYDQSSRIPVVNSLEHRCNILRPLPNATSTGTSTAATTNIYCSWAGIGDSPVSLFNYASSTKYTLRSFTSSGDIAPSLTLPGKTFTSNSDFKALYDENIRKAKESASF